MAFTCRCVTDDECPFIFLMWFRESMMYTVWSQDPEHIFMFMHTYSGVRLYVCVYARVCAM
jgi:hypothetical protein